MKVYYQTPTNEQFNERYSGPGAGTLSKEERQRVRNVQVTKKKQAQPSGKSIDSGFRDEYAKKGLQPTYLQNNEPNSSRKKYQSTEQVDRTARAEYAAQNAPVTIKERGRYQIQRKIKNKKRFKIKKPSILKRARAVGTTTGIWAWGFWTYFWFQLPFAILSIVFMGVTMAIYEFTQSLEPAEDDGFLTAAVKWGGRVISAGADTFTELFVALVKMATGLDLTLFNPPGFFIMTLIIAMIIGWLTLMIMALVYMLARVRPLNSGGKMGLFLLALIGYSIPIFNLFPWFFLWTLAVVKNPK